MDQSQALPKKSKRDLMSKRGVTADESYRADMSEDEKNPQKALQHALKLAVADSKSTIPTLPRTRERSITKRAVLWLGQTCNLRCYFCYFLDRIEIKSHPEHPFMSLDKAKEICRTLREHYGNDSIDIQGGEPTIWPDILKLVSYCHEIGLEPTLITNALVLEDRDRCKQYIDAGINDFLVSVHGIGEVHDRVVQMPGAHVKQMNALKNMRELGIPFRFNCVMSKPVVNQLPQISELAVATGARVVNFLAFNPFEDQAKGGRRSGSNVPMYSELRPKLNEALDILDDNGVEANVRYLPICMANPRHRKSMYNFQQLSYDHHEWDYASWSWTGMQQQRMKSGDVTNPATLTSQSLIWKLRKPISMIMRIPILGRGLHALHNQYARFVDKHSDQEALYRSNAKVRSELHCGYRYGDECQKCSVKEICDGFHGDYADLFGTDEAEAIVLPQQVKDPKYYISQQDKDIEPFEELERKQA
ncbi:MAG: radical SAM protein [Bdellovibrionales bacterium]|nr:radical SAM protein [Bdellovibrionales bacterium]